MWSLSGHNSLGLQIILLPPFNLIFIIRTQKDFMVYVQNYNVKSHKCYFINPMLFRTFPNKLKIKQEVAEHSDVLIDRKNYWPNKIIGA